MLSILAALLIGWLWSLIGLDTVLNHLVGFTSQQYYLVWFAMGFVIWMYRLFGRPNNK
jgi:hypothetical protein